MLRVEYATGIAGVKLSEICIRTCAASAAIVLERTDLALRNVLTAGGLAVRGAKGRLVAVGTGGERVLIFFAHLGDR